METQLCQGLAVGLTTANALHPIHTVTELPRVPVFIC